MKKVDRQTDRQDDMTLSEVHKKGFYRDRENKMVAIVLVRTRIAIERMRTVSSPTYVRVALKSHLNCTTSVVVVVVVVVVVAISQVQG